MKTWNARKGQSASVLGDFTSAHAVEENHGELTRQLASVWIAGDEGFSIAQQMAKVPEMRRALQMLLDAVDVGTPIIGGLMFDQAIAAAHAALDTNRTGIAMTPLEYAELHERKLWEQLTTMLLESPPVTKEDIDRVLESEQNPEVKIVAAYRGQVFVKACLNYGRAVARRAVCQEQITRTYLPELR